MTRHLSVAAAVLAVSLSAQEAQDQFVQVQALHAQLLSSRSATATLERWCRDHRLADPPRVIARAAAGAIKTPSPDQLRRLDVTDAREVKYRHVRLECGTHLLSEADNWYVPARLTPEMNRLLDDTGTPFGQAVAPLEPYRKTIADDVRWTDRVLPPPDTLFEVHAVLYTREHKPFSEVAESYRRSLLEVPVP